MKITYLSDPHFYDGSLAGHADMKVFPKVESYHPNTDMASYGRSLYLMFKEDGQWKIGEEKD
ncbi:hypothetical protein [Paenibacillus dakarensis]|uniref:hypothetical protein n=1 Tax=Paenibacillus dakarensis TaxID=1527293 RepID=UPI0012E13416|nr:hypothetical protein [Paenibacillus dakarensis]